MANIILRGQKGSPLTNAEVDANFTNLNNELVSASTNITNITQQITNIEQVTPQTDDVIAMAIALG